VGQRELELGTSEFAEVVLGRGFVGLAGLSGLVEVCEIQRLYLRT